MTRLGAQHGFDAACVGDVTSDPVHKAAYEKRRDSLKTLRTVANEHDDTIVDQGARLAKLEAAVKALPFPWAGS